MRGARPPRSEPKKRTRKTKNKILATASVAEAIPENPNTDASSASTKNNNAQRNSINPPRDEWASVDWIERRHCQLRGSSANPYLLEFLPRTDHTLIQLEPCRVYCRRSCAFAFLFLRLSRVEALLPHSRSLRSLSLPRYRNLPLNLRASPYSSGV